jgi:hypothetical protein
MLEREVVPRFRNQPEFQALSRAAQMRSDGQEEFFFGTIVNWRPVESPLLASA